MRRCWAEVSLSRVKHNLEVIRRLAGGREVVAVVKANAYGHGMEQVSRCLWGSGVRRFAVADLGEACRLRKTLHEASILVFGGCGEGEEEEFRSLNLIAALFDDRIPGGVDVEIEVETGMGRLGLPVERVQAVARAVGAAHLRGVYSTLSSSDCDPDWTRQQVERFNESTAGLAVPRHLSNSAGLQYPQARFDAVRPGLALYGIANSPALIELHPALRWKARVVSVNLLPKGSRVGYGGSWVAPRPSRIAILGVGYGDGYSRRLSGQGEVLTESGFAPLVGRVSMDLTAVDVTDHAQVEVGSMVTLLDWDPASPISAAGLAGRLETIPYEVLTSIGSRVERVFVE